VVVPIEHAIQFRINYRPEYCRNNTGAGFMDALEVETTLGKMSLSYSHSVLNALMTLLECYQIDAVCKENQKADV
jgi:hypothetical protein